MRRNLQSVLVTALVLAGTAGARQMAPPPPPAPAPKSAPVRVDGLRLAANGHCEVALPLLKRALAASTDKARRKQLGIAVVKCAMDTGAADDAASALRTLNRDFAGDAEVLLLAVHIYSDLSISASRALMRTAPGSPQVHDLNAEALESQGRWDDAEKEYRTMLARFPGYAGVHFKLGRLLLSEPSHDARLAEARTEFEAELAQNPDNAAAECVLGELARQESQWPESVAHFRKAVVLDPDFYDALLGLGRALLGSGRAGEAVGPLEQAMRLQPATPITHLQLGYAYQQLGRGADANRELAAAKQTSERMHQSSVDVKNNLVGEPGAAPRPPK
jgi:predicted Zn-dependent protease